MPENKRSMAVYCGHQAGNDPKYMKDAIKLGKLMTENKMRLIYGGGNVGLMGGVSMAVRDNGGEVIGVSTPGLVQREPMLDGIEMEVKDTLMERKHRMIELSDAFCILPGGLGTLNEVSDILTMHQIGETILPIYFLNTNGFWNIMGDMLKHMIDAGFVKGMIEYNMMICNTPEEVIKAYNSRFFA